MSWIYGEMNHVVQKVQIHAKEQWMKYVTIQNAYLVIKDFFVFPWSQVWCQK